MGRRALDRLADDALDLTARRQQFVPIAILTLGNAGTSTDGFDQMFSDAAGHVDSEQNVGTSLDPDLAAADFAPGQIVASTLTPTVQDYAAFASVDPATIGATPASTGSAVDHSNAAAVARLQGVSLGPGTPNDHNPAAHGGKTGAPVEHQNG